MTTTQQSHDLPRAICDAFADVQSGKNPDAARATLAALRDQHGDAAFDAAKLKAVVALARNR